MCGCFYVIFITKMANRAKNKSVNDIKNIINTYVESVLVYDEKVEVNLLIVHINGGGDGYRTRVRR